MIHPKAKARLLFIFTGLPLIGLLIQCPSLKQAEPNTLFVSIAPQKFLVEKIVGGRFMVKAVLPPGASPVTFNPSPKNLDFSRALIYFKIGLPFESALLERIKKANEKLTLIDSSTGIDFIKMPSVEMILKGKHEEEDLDHHHHEGHDPHVWTSPELVKTQAKTIKDVLIERFPSYKDEFENNYLTLIDDIKVLQENIKTILMQATNKAFMVFHPAWGYFAKEFGLTQVPIEIEGKEPSGKSLEKLIDFAKRENISSIFIQPQFSQKVATAIAKEINGSVVTLDPLSEDYLFNLTEVAKNIAGK